MKHNETIKSCDHSNKTCHERNANKTMVMMYKLLISL